MRLAAAAAEVAVAVAVSTGFAVPAGTEAPAREAFRFTDPAIDESSGLAVLGDLVLTVNDSGDDPVVYAVDPATGDTVGRTTYSTEPVQDVEALAVGPDGTVWVADIGDNRAQRVSVAVYRLPAVGRGDRTVVAERFDLVYDDGPRDAETLLVHPRTGRLAVVSKGLFAGAVHLAPRRLDPDRPNRLREVGEVGGLVTDGAWFPDGRHVVLRDYGRATVWDAEDWTLLGRIRMPDQPQSEGLAVTSGGRRVLVSSEGTHETVWSVVVPPALMRAMRPQTAPAPSPAGEEADDPERSLSPGEDLAYRPDERVWWLAGGGAVVAGAALAWAAVRAARRRSRSTR